MNHLSLRYHGLLTALAWLLVAASASPITQSLRSGATFAGIDGTCKFEKPGDPDWMFSRFTCVVPYAECPASIDDWRAKSPGARLYYYISGTDMPSYRSSSSTMFNGGKKAAWIRDRIVQLGGIQEEAYMHFYNDTRIRNWNGSSWDTMLIPGTNSLTIQPKDSVSRVPNGYISSLFSGGNTFSYPTRLAPNFPSARLRQAYKEWVTLIFSSGGDSNWPNRTGYWDGVFFDNYNHTNLKGAGLVSGGLVVETGTSPANLLTYGTDTFAEWGWNWMLVFGREVHDTLKTSAQWSIDHKHKQLAYNFGNYHKTILENPDSSGCDLVHYEFGWDPVYCNNSSVHRLENLYSRDSLAASRGVTYFWCSMPRTSYDGWSISSLRQAIYNNLCFYLAARSDSTWLFMRPASGNAYGAFLNPGFDTLAWIPAMGYELGWPAQHYQLTQSGASPDQSGGTYKVWQREYPNGRVYIRARDGFESKWGDASTAVTVNLGGSYRKLLADGSLSDVITQISLRGGEGAIIVPTTSSGGADCPTPPTRPTNATPGNGTLAASVTPSLCVTSSTQSGCEQPIRYHFQISTSSSFALVTQENVAVPHTSGTSCWQVPVNLAPATTYYWRVRAGNGSLWSAWSSTTSFATPNTPPLTPTLNSPANGATVNARQPTLIVNNTTDPEGVTPTYQFQVSLNSSFTSIPAQASNVVQGAGGTTSWQVGSPLTNLTTYYWRVRASDGTYSSPWSSARTFIVNVSLTNTPPTTPTLSAPANGAAVATLTPTLRIVNSTDANGNTITYQFELYDSSLTTLIQISSMLAQGSGTTTWTLATNLVDGAYYRWRARAYDGQAWSGYMEPAGFRIVLANNPPTVPGPLTPTAGQPVYGHPITLVANNATDPDGDPLYYLFRTCSDSLLTAQVEISGNVAQQSPYTTYQSTANYQHNRRYWWTVRAFDGSAYSAWAPAQVFTHYDMALDAGEVATLLYPVDGATEMSAHPTFEIGWSGDRDTIACTFEVSRDRDFVDLFDAGIVVGYSGSARWTPQRALENETIYYWRAKLATDGYSETAKFTVSSPVFVSPNPFSYLDGELVFRNLPPGSRLEIFTASGDRIVAFDNLSGEYHWDVRNPSGEKLAPGVFLYYVRFDDKTIADKFIVVR